MSCQGRPPVHHGHTPDPAARGRPVPSAPRGHEPGQCGKCVSFPRVHVFPRGWVCRSGRGRPASRLFKVGPLLASGMRAWSGLTLRPVRAALCLQCPCNPGPVLTAAPGRLQCGHWLCTGVLSAGPLGLRSLPGRSLHVAGN